MINTATTGPSQEMRLKDIPQKWVSTNINGRQPEPAQLRRAQEVINDAGHAIVALHPDEPHSIGDLLLFVWGYDFGQPFRIIAKASAGEWIEQGIRLGLSVQTPVGAHYFRAVTD